MVILSRVPYPLEKGDKLRAYHLVKRLARKHEIYLFCLSDGPTAQEHLDHLHQFCAHIEVVRIERWRIVLKLFSAIFSRLPFQVAYFHHRKAQRRINAALEQFRPEHILCQLVRTTEYVREVHDVPKTLDYMDTLSKGLERRSEMAPTLLAPLFRAETRRLIRYENLMLDLFDHSVIISAQDREYIYHPWRDRIAVIPNGVDSEHFTPRHGRQDHDIVFTGNMNYPPNIDSALYLAQQILPLVRRTRPNTTLLISGVAPSQSVRDLGRTDPLIHVSGWVKDIRDSYASARLFVAPMQIGTGLQNKLLEAMAMRIPCITSTLANNAVGARPGDAILVGNSPEEYAAHILHLLDDPAERARIAENGYQFIRSQFDWDKAAEKLDRMISQGA
jgi:sugar transferase (PEP-CTERM/EpsH1 system associated)